MPMCIAFYDGRRVQSDQIGLGIEKKHPKLPLSKTWGPKNKNAVGEGLRHNKGYLFIVVLILGRCL